MRFLAKVGVGLLWSVPAWAGVVFEIKSAKQDATYSIEGAKLRVEQQSADGNPRIIVVDNSERTLTLLNPKAKTYNKLELDKIEALTKAAHERMEQAMSKMSPEQRKAMAQPEDATGEVKFEPMGKKDKVAGHPCEWSRGLRGTTPFVEACFIPWSATGLSQTDFAPAMKTIESLRAMGARVGQGAEGGNLTGAVKPPGFPAIRIPLLAGDKRGEEERLVSLKKTTVAPEVFAIPEGFTANGGPGGSPK